ncbi:MAG: carbon-nitrogen hydrolase family protein [Candidatus Poribacteria bacterium]|jgi:predicted amidohydrolase|nr:carbon-nitrogen hydrolase family protein [Candidatus Poribacteria bacterium]MDP6959912.1 carbon-nitrogen hydrolase family protein [Dehalococcoidia bacterium]
MNLRVAGAQISVGTDIADNVATIERAIDYARDEKAEILLTPEGSLSGYTHQFDSQRVDEALTRIRERAKTAGIGLALGTCFLEPEDRNCYNQIRFYTQNGTYLGFHSKILTCGSMTNPPEGEINHYTVSPLRTFDFNQVKVGGLICNDLWANPGCTPIPDPHLSHELSEMDTRIIFHAVNGGRSASEWSDVAWDYHQSNLRMRARSGRIWIVTVDNCSPIEIRCSSPSGVINPQGEWVCQVPSKGEQLFSYTITDPT